ncbi:MAG: gamma-glutamyl-gamma-aminobutyrate hydrolase family protein [Deltaproteobacteria bacterium]|nr:gamma-glutamyl-gamma-aminobutyrate hydrolase family protein [Deltaproteobacteria bacterium]
MRIHYLQHVPFEGLGYIEVWAKNVGCILSSTKLYDKPIFPNLDEFDWLIIMGGPMSVHDTDVFSWLISEKEFILNAIENKKCVLGICLGAQLIANVLGAKVYQGIEKEIGWFPIEKIKNSTESLIDIFPDIVDVFHWHGETYDIPDGAVHIVRSAVCENQGFVFCDKVIGFQFHLESTLESVKELIKNCSDEIIEAPYIQTSEMMLADEIKFHKINEIMNNILNYQLNIT